MGALLLERSAMAVSGLGERIASVRKRRGLSQRERAELSGVSVSLLRKLEQGERADTRVETLRKLAVALRAPTSALIVRPETEDARVDMAQQWAPIHDALIGFDRARGRYGGAADG
jgi:transcriptional regulator with XRE-family HTH domain